MKYATVILIIFLLALLIEYQMISVNHNDRKEKCSVVIVDHVLQKATDYEYYNCMSK